MALIQMSILSKTLMRTVPVTVIVPIDKLTFPGMPVREDKPFKTLYLLHGVFGSTEDWNNNTRIKRFAEENDLVVVMPSGENAFYLDHEEMHNLYGEFIGKELVELTRKLFPLSDKREDTFIGGLSMGGYGALRNGLKYSETFGSIVALSSAIALDEWSKLTEESPLFINSASYVKAIFGDQSTMLERDTNPKWLVEKALEKGVSLPYIYMACGDKDSLLKVNMDFDAFLTEKNVPHLFEIGPGAHEWDFWDTYIKKAVYQWLPTEKNGEGIHSGNVGI